MKEQFIKNENEKEGKKKQNKPRFKEEEYTSKNKYPSDIEDEEKKEDEEISYLDIFQRPSFRNVRKNIMSTEDHSVLEVDNFEQEKTKDQYDYPVNIFKKFLFTWTRKVLKASNSKPQLEISDLGKFSPELYPDNFLREIKQAWEKISKKTKNSPLIKTLLYNNISVLILIFIGNIFVCGSETLNVLLYRQVILHLDEEPESEPLFDLLTTMILLLINKLIYNFIFRLYEAYTTSTSYRIIIQLDSLIYDKLLKTSLYANVSEGSLINFIQIDAEAFGDFFTYTPATMVLPFQIIFFIYLLFSFFGVAFIFGLLSLIIILIISSCLQKIRTEYQKYVLEKKDRRMKTTTQAFQMIKIVKLYSWEDYFTKKITQERNEELKYFKKINTINVFINCIFWSTGPIMSFVSICAYNYFNEEMSLSNVLTGLFIFHTLADPLFLLPEYINCLSDSLLSLKRLEVFLSKKEYNPTELIKNLYPKAEDKIAIEIDNMDFGIIKKREEFVKEEYDESVEKEESEKYDTNKNKKKDDSDDSEEENEKGIELQDLNFNNKEEKNNEIQDKLLLDEHKEKDINLKIKENNGKNDDNKSNEEIPEIEIIELLKGINLKIEKGDLIGIVGAVGSGKTCLLNAILNNLDVLNNPEGKKIKINGSIAYVPQKAWIMNETVRNNIVFKRDFNEERYKRVVNICQLIPDFELFKSGDMTQISDKGSNLSGGQKTRITIARAVYSDSDIYLFDDPLSALDSHVGESIFNELMKDYLKSKTILVVTHALQYIPMMNKVIYIDNGKIAFFGKPEDAMELPFFKKALSLEERKKYSELSKKKKKLKAIVMSEYNDTEQENLNSDSLVNKLKTFRRQKSKKKNEKIEYVAPTKIQSFKLIFSFCGGCCFLFCIILFCLFWRITDSASDFIIAKWSAASNEVEPEINYFNWYLVTKLFGILFVFIRSYIIILGLVNFNKRMHEALLMRLMRAPINIFHDIVSKSHIFNRFSKDLENSIKYFNSFNYSLTLLFNLLSAIIISIMFYWQCIFIVPILIFLQHKLYIYYTKCAKQLFILESFTRLPILNGFSETLAGLSSIRSYDYAEKFRKDYHQRLHNFYRVLIYQNGCLSWFALNIDLIGFCLLFFILVVAYFMRNTANGSIIGVLLSYVLKLVEKNFYFYEQFNINERTSKSLESCEAYTHVVQEAPLTMKKDTILRSNNFPQTGKIEFRNFSVRYRPDTKIILKNLTFTISSGEKIGIVGRTGSGKSTLCLCLFRILEPSNGQILIDDVDITKIGLSLLREIITVIPQDPTLIEGTLRENLDPAGHFTDEDMTFNMNLIGLAYLLNDNGLDFQVREDGKNLSSGEKQLICMVRAILRKSKIIIMDEATSSIDYNTEKLIQKTLLNNLKGSTIITIAHRIKTIIGYDRIFVLDKGELIEEGSPQALIDKKGIFYQLYNKSHV
jgi:ATP-binding cassette subfamily C (CFTR/MRP) protein 1